MNEQPLPKKTRDILGQKMAYYDHGQGTPIVFLHGNPTSSYLWRDVIPELRGQGRLIAPDMIGMGDSEKLPSPGPDTYNYETHRRYLWGLIDALTRPDEKIVLVIHDWGSAIGFDWASAHPDRVSAIAYMEAILHPLDWSEWDPTLAPVFQGFRSEAGEKMTLDARGMREDYQKSVEEFRRYYREECAKANIDYVAMDTSVNFDKALLEYLIQRQRRF